ncbi:hypothetical protein BASA82_000282 [Batrachochytrium salamandrivorans]|nr:hypothetical protein BASA81_002547 [Batrachochytrium salamandrivorans]KAH9262679.1 hypothetical protein BASA82_000282 [Batrachochytrium salamandrivorans]
MRFAWLLAENTLSLDNDQTLLSILRKLPSAVPFLMAKVKTDECKRDLRNFSAAVRQSPKELEGTIEGIRATLCKVPTDCIQEVLDAMREMISTGGMVEKMVRGFLEGKGVDLESVDFLLLGYLETLCSGGGDGTRAEEL